MPFSIVRQDITKMKVDAIVNAANAELQMGGGVCGAIFRAAKTDLLQSACNRLAPIQTGEAVVTESFGLAAKYIIHTAGPVYRGGAQGEAALLRACYHNSLRQAAKHGCASIAFPLISSGIYRYPKEQALQVATAAIKEFLSGAEMEVFLAVFDPASFAVSQTLLGEVTSYLDEHYIDAMQQEPRARKLLHAEIYELKLEEAVFPAAGASATLEHLIGNLDESFSETVLRLIDAKGKSDVEVYQRANLDRKLFSKLRTAKSYTPSKRTALALAVALELTLDETDGLLRRAGYALSHSQKFDVILEYFIINGRYDIFQINEVLFSYDQPLLGG